MAPQNPSLLEEPHQPSMQPSGVDFEVAESLLQHSRAGRDGGEGSTHLAVEPPTVKATSLHKDQEVGDNQSVHEQKDRHSNPQEPQLDPHCEHLNTAPTLGQVCRYNTHHALIRMSYQGLTSHTEY